MTETALTIHLTRPGAIDAEPAEVGSIAANEISSALSALHGLMPEVVVQARSSHASRLMNASPAIEAAELSEAWLDADAHSQIVRAAGLIARAADLLRAAAISLDQEAV